MWLAVFHCEEEKLCGKELVGWRGARNKDIKERCGKTEVLQGEREREREREIEGNTKQTESRGQASSETSSAGPLSLIVPPQWCVSSNWVSTPPLINSLLPVVTAPLTSFVEAARLMKGKWSGKDPR